MRYLPLGQSFWVQRLALPSSQQFVFKTTGVTLSNPSNLSKPQTQPGEYHFTLRSVNSANGKVIKTYLSARNQANDNFQMHEDVVARFNENGYQQFYTYQDNVALSINTQSKLMTGSRSIPLYFEHNQPGIFTIEPINADEQDHAFTVVLEDRHSKILTDLYQSGYTFQHHPSIEVNRFMIHINAPAVGVINQKPTKTNLWTSSDKIFIQKDIETVALLEIIDLTGKTVYSNRTALSRGVHVFQAPVLPKGLYLIRLTESDQSTTIKTIF